MKPDLIKVCLIGTIGILIVTNAYTLLNWASNYRYGEIVVNAPKTTKAVITETSSNNFKIEVTTGRPVSLVYGWYSVEVPEYSVKCSIFKNNRGTATVTVLEPGKYEVTCNENASEVK